MAETAARYASKGTYGNLAYDYSAATAVPRYMPEELPSAPTRDLPRETPREATRVRTKTAEKSPQAVAPFAIVGYLCAAVILVFVLLGYVQLTQLSSEAVKYEAQLEELKDQKAKLMIEYERTFNLTEVEEYARDVLGMVRAGSSQIYYVDGAGADRAVIINNAAEEETLTFWREITSFFSMIVEYFR